MGSIKVSELKFLFSRIIDKLEVVKGKEGSVNIKTSNYRLIPTEKWNTFNNPEDWFSASEIDLGDLRDDLNELKKLITNKERPCMFVDFDRLASLLREISQVENPI